jgi:hypothetical protein
VKQRKYEPPNPSDDTETWDDIIPQGDGKSPDWELRIWADAIKRSCPKCGTTGEKNWNLRWLKPGSIPEMPDECLKVLCIRCGWWFYMETLEQAEKRKPGGDRPPSSASDVRFIPIQKPNDLVRQRIRHMTPESVKALIDHVNELVDEDGKLVCTFLGETHRALRIALGCPAPTDAEPLPAGHRKPLAARWS